MNLQNIETLLLQEMENVRGGVGGICLCTSGALQGSNGQCSCTTGAAQDVITPICQCDGGAEQLGVE